MSEYILTFDVGIKNLAFCLVKYDTISNSSKVLDNINIIDWDILDVSYKPLYCKQIKNKRAICNCISKYYSLKNDNLPHNDLNNLIGYCKNHYKIIASNNKINKNNQIKLYKISLNPIYKENFNIQMDRLLSSLQKFFINRILNPYDIKFNKLQHINKLRIYIENQPCLKNPTMKTISIGIFTYFTIKKIEYPQIINSINFISAGVKTKDAFINKLKNLISVNSSITHFKKYENRKEFAIDISNQIIHNLPPNINNIVSISKYIINKKKDDFADTLIYVIYIIIFNFL